MPETSADHRFQVSASSGPLLGCVFEYTQYKHLLPMVPSSRSSTERSSHLGRSTLPRHSMYATDAYIGVVLEVNVGIYGIHGVSTL